MTTLLIKNADVLVTMNDDRAEIANGALIAIDNQIAWVGESCEAENWLVKNHPEIAKAGVDKVIDAAKCVVTPGLVNCHHHFYQSLTRGVATGPGKNLFDWLRFLYPIWEGLTSDAIYTSAKISLAELVMSGCTTASDHLYIYPNDSRIDDEIRAAQEIGVRFHPNRGSMTVGESQGGLAPDSVCEDENFVIKECIRAIETYHDPGPFSMLRIGVAPNMPNTVSLDLMRESARIAASYPMVKLHTHTSETEDDNNYTIEHYGLRPIEYCESLGWVGEHVWFAHLVKITEDEVDWLAKTRTGACHCPSSNMILGSGIAPIRQMIDKKVRVGLGVDGTSSNDGNHLLGEARLAMLLQRVGWPGFQSSASRFTAREALELATIGGARVLQQEDTIGVLSPGRAADFVAYRMDDLAHAGGRGDPVSSLLTCYTGNVWLSVINGKVVVEDGQFLPFELEPVVEQHNKISLGLLERAGL